PGRHTGNDYFIELACHSRQRHVCRHNCLLFYYYRNRLRRITNASNNDLSLSCWNAVDDKISISIARGADSGTSDSYVCRGKTSTCAVDHTTFHPSNAERIEMSSGYNTA